VVATQVGLVLRAGYCCLLLEIDNAGLFQHTVIRSVGLLVASSSTEIRLVTALRSRETFTQLLLRDSLHNLREQLPVVADLNAANEAGAEEAITF